MTATATNAACLAALNLSPGRVHKNLSVARLVEEAIRRGEGTLASNGGLVALTGDRTGRSPKDKYLEDSPEIHAKIGWGGFNAPITPGNFDAVVKIATDHLNGCKDLFCFEGFVGADPKHRLGARVITEQAWHNLFIRTLFIPTDSRAAGPNAAWKHDWTILNAGKRRLTAAEQAALGVKSPVIIVQSLTRKLVVIVGSEYAGEMKKSLFYAMNFDMPEAGVFPMHCSCNVDKKDPSNVALFFGLSGTGKTTLSADPNRALVGDDEHGWTDHGVFNFEGGCYAKCIKLSKEGEPQIWNAIRFGSVLENVKIDPATRVPDYDSDVIAENSRATYPLDFIDGAVIPSMAAHPKNVVFLTADAYGVMPPVSKLTREQAMYYFINGYTSKLAGTELGVKEPQPNFSACFGAPFLPRPAKVYAEMLAAKVARHSADVWLLNTGWTGGPYGTGQRFKLAYTRAFVTAILNGTLRNAKFTPDPVFGLPLPDRVEGVPSEVLNPRNTWKDGAAYDAQARKLAQGFRDNDKKFDMPEAVRAAGPRI
ncbi:MAG: phosphoenolpyruvate carboxykinase (ATP) [Phycisphaeraceae bacterium]|nr:phosphoenolpyruvate carboxykinase (ATP) [Phycisphaeraceae bacterium]